MREKKRGKEKGEKKRGHSTLATSLVVTVNDFPYFYIWKCSPLESSQSLPASGPRAEKRGAEKRGHSTFSLEVIWSSPIIPTCLALVALLRAVIATTS